MIINRQSLLTAAPIKNMLTTKKREHGVSYGLAEAGYDIRIKQSVLYNPDDDCIWVQTPPMRGGPMIEGNFCLASAIEEFQMPQDLVAVVHDKSTWARQGLSVLNTVIEPGWCGFLTLELVFHSKNRVHIPAGCGIAQVIFHKVSDIAQYEGKYQNQADEPVASLWDESKDGSKK